MRTQSVNAVVAGDEAVGALAFATGVVSERRNNLFLWLGSQRAAVAYPPPEAPPTAATTPASFNCGGDLPPCYVVERESGGSYTAYNPSGCADFCFGKYQFSSDWGGKLGLPEDIRQATPEQQDAAARELWANGAGCSHWAACN